MSSIAVFCGSSSGARESFRREAESLGHEIAERGHRLVYGGGHVGLMGIVADAVLGAGGDVVGVITSQLRTLEVAHLGLTELEVVETMHQRKARMAELADGVVVLPGGFGTYDEAFEILTWNQLGIVHVPVVFVDVDDFYSPLLDFVAGAVDAGFIRPDHGALARRAGSAAEAVTAATSASGDIAPKWVG